MAIVPINFAQTASTPNASSQAPTPLPQTPGIGSKILTGAENIGKDAFNTLIGTPATRFGQLVGNAVAPALGATPEGIARANSQSVDLPLGMGTIPAQKGGIEGAKQITGQGLKAAAYLAPEFMGAEGVVTKGIVNGVTQGVKIGATSGALAGSGNALSQGGGISDVISQGASGAVTGAVTGGVTGGVANIWAKAYGNGSSYKTNLQNATESNIQAGENATNSIHEASNTMSDVTTGVGNQFDQAPKIISQIDPSARVTIPANVVDEALALKETKAYSLPDYIKNPSTPSDIANIGSGERILTPEQAQDFIKGLNDLKYNSKGDVVVNQQTSNLVNKVKTLAQNDLGHVTDAEGNSVWSRSYQDYQQVMDAKDAMSSLIPTKKTQGSILDPIEVNDSVNKMMKMLETPQGTSALTRANAEFKSVTGYDLLNDPMGSIAKLAESNKEIARALKGGYGHQFIKGLENPTIASRRLIYAVTTILGITGLGTAFRKQIGNFISGQ